MLRLKSAVFCVLYLTVNTCLAQNSPSSQWPKEDQKVFEITKILMDEKNYGIAYDRFYELLKKHPDELYLKYLLGICGIYVSDKHLEAQKFLEEVAAKNKKAADLDFYFTLLHHKVYMFDKAIDESEKLLAKGKLKPDQVKALNLVIEHSKTGKELCADSLKVKIKNLGSPPNSHDAEYSPVLTSDEKTIYYTYRGDKSTGGLRDLFGNQNKFGLYFEDAYTSKFVNNSWETPAPLENVNTAANDAIVALSNDGQKLFLFRSSPEDGGDLYECEFKGDKFSEPKKLSGAVNTKAWEGSMSLSGNQRMIIFSSERPGGLGGKDLYSAIKMPDGSWGKVRNLGSEINTSENEDAPFLHPDGKTLLFSSTGHKCMGGFDIFIANFKEADSSWVQAVNIGYPINTTDDDIFYILSADGKRGYYSSSKPEGYGDKDIYVVEPALPSRRSDVTIIKGKITENKRPYAADVYVDLNSNTAFGNFRPNPATGNYLISVPSGNSYRLTFKHPGYGKKHYEVDASKVGGYAEKIINVNFDGGDTLSGIKIITVNPEDSLHLDIDSVFSSVKEIPSNTMAPKESVPDQQAPKVNLKDLSRAQLMEKFGNEKIENLKYIVQVGAYRKPKNFQGKKLSSAGSIKENGLIMEDVHLLVMNKEFDTWKEANEFLEKVKSLGQPDAFITASYKGTRYYLSQLIDKGIWGEKL